MITKEQLRNYLEDKNDITLGQILKELEASVDDIDSTEVYLRELVQEGWIRKEFCREHGVFEFKIGGARTGFSGEL